MAKVPGFAKPYAEVGRQAHRRNGHQATLRTRLGSSTAC
jgi:hypothetical protein